jgi:hypothetical protein
MPAGLVVQHRFEGRPTGIQNGLRHLGFRQSGRIDIANHDQRILSGNSAGRLVQMVVATVFDLLVNRFHPSFVVSTLCRSEFLSQSLLMT